MLLHPQDAEEATQDALLAVARNIRRFEGRSRFTTWLHAIAGNSARSTYRSLKRRAAEHLVDDLPSDPDPRTTSVIAGSRLDLLEALEVLAATSPEQVEPLVLRDVRPARLQRDRAAARPAAGHGQVPDPPRPSVRAAAARRQRRVPVTPPTLTPAPVHPQRDQPRE